MSTIDTGKDTPKRALTQEDKAFLTVLQRALKTQPTGDTRNPCYWVIQVTERIYGVAADEADGWVLYDTENPELTVGHPNDSQSVYDEVSGGYSDEDMDEDPDLIDALFELKEAADEEDPEAMADHQRQVLYVRFRLLSLLPLRDDIRKEPALSHKGRMRSLYQGA